MATEISIQAVIDLFKSGASAKASQILMTVYNNNGEQEKQYAMSLMKKFCYEPYEAMLKMNYENNICLLKEYPYFWRKDFIDFEELPFLLFVVDDYYIIFDKKTDKFVCKYDGKSKKNMRYFFENLDEALKIKNEDNLYNLAFLADNVRRSEDVAMDNHIYLLYDSWEPLQRVMQMGDLSSLLTEKKFVFLVGQENFSRYPIDFKACFGIDYESMEPAIVRIEELKRICFWFKHAYSGTALGCGVLDASRFTSVFCEFNTPVWGDMVNGISVLQYVVENAVFSTPDKEFSIKELLHLVESSESTMKNKDILGCLRWVTEAFPDREIWSFIDMFKAFFVYLYKDTSRKSRIVPLIVFEPHLEYPSLCYNFMYKFLYVSTLTSIRNPIVTFARCYQYGHLGRNKRMTQYYLAAEYAHASSLSKELRENYWGYRFEDMKAQPEKVIRGLCRILNIPFEESLLQVDVPMKDLSNNIVRGFDQAPLHRDISPVLSEFDQMRLKIFYAPILKYYGYPEFPFHIHPISEKLVRSLFEIPFKFESYNHKVYKNAPSPQVLHEWIQEVLQQAFNKSICCPQLIPLDGTE